MVCAFTGFCESICGLGYKGKSVDKRTIVTTRKFSIMGVQFLYLTHKWDALRNVTQGFRFTTQPFLEILTPVFAKFC